MCCKMMIIHKCLYTADTWNLCFIHYVHFYLQARVQRGNILLKQGNLKEALEDFQEAVSLYICHTLQIMTLIKK